MGKGCTLGYFLAELRLVYRKDFHRRYTKRSQGKHENRFESKRVTACKIRTNDGQTETSEDKHVRLRTQNIDHSTSTYSYREGRDDMAFKDDTNNSAGKHITVQEFENGVNDRKKKVSCNKPCSLQKNGGNRSFAEEKRPLSDDEKSNTRVMNMGHNNDNRCDDKQPNTEACQKEKNSFDKRTLPNIPISKEAELSSTIDQIRDAQRSLRKKIRDLENDLETKMAEGKLQSEAMDEMNNDIVQFKVAVIQEAQDFEKILKQNADENIKLCQSTCSQLSRIKAVAILNDFLKELDIFTQLLDMDSDSSISILNQEISVLKHNLTVLTKQREDIIHQKVTVLRSANNIANSDILVESVEDKENAKSEYFQTNRPEKSVFFSVLSNNHMTKASGNKSPFHDLLSCLNVGDIEDDSKTQRETDRKHLYEQRKKWEKLDRQYRKHSENMRKRSELLSNKSKQYASPTENKHEKSTDTHFSLGIKFDITCHENIQQIKTTLKHLKQHSGESIKMGYDNLRQLCKDTTNHSVCRPIKDHALVLTKHTKQRIENLRVLLSDICESLSKIYEPVKNTLNDHGKRTKKYFNYLCKRYTEMKRNFSHQKKFDFPNTKASKSQIIISHIRVFLHRVKLVAKFRNMLLFDREILLPQKRFNLFEWYDLPIAVMYGIERFHQIENLFQRRMNMENDLRDNECRFDLRVYGPLEYQLGRALTYNEMALLQEEKIATLRNAVFKKNRKRKRKSHTHLALAELKDNTCVSCLRCVKDIVFGCHRCHNPDRDISDTDEYENELGVHVDVRQDTIEDLVKRPRDSDTSSNLSRRRSTTFGVDEDILSDEIEYTPYRRASLLDSELRRSVSILQSPDRVRFS